MRWVNRGVGWALSGEKSMFTPRSVSKRNLEKGRMQGVRTALAGPETGEDFPAPRKSLEVFGFYLEGKGEFKG